MVHGIDRQWLTYHEVKVVGVKYDNRQDVLREVARSDDEYVILLEPEPDNEYDCFAVKVDVARRNNERPSEPIVKHAGYLPSDLANDVAYPLMLGYVPVVTDWRLVGDFTLGLRIDFELRDPKTDDVIGDFADIVDE